MKNIFINDNHQIRSGWKIVIALLSIFLVVPIILGTLLLPIFALCGFNTSDRYTLSQISIYIQEIITIIIPIILWKLLDKKNLTELGLPSIKNNHQNFIYGLLFGALSLTAAAIIILCTNSSILKGSLLKPNLSLPILTALILYILVGFSEEILCRGYFLSVLKQCKNKYVPYMGSAVIFALMHSLNPGISVLSYINLFLFGLFAAYAVYKTKSIWLGIGFHITWNFFQGNVWGFLVSGTTNKDSIYTIQVLNKNIINGGDFAPEGGLAVTLILILLIIMLYKFVPIKKEAENDDYLTNTL